MPAAGHFLDQFVRCLQFLRGDVELVLGKRGKPGNLSADLAHVHGGVGNITRSRLPLGTDHGGALVDPAERFAQVSGTADEGNGELPLVDVVGVVGRGQDLGLVNVVDAEGLQDLGLDEVSDAGLGHDGNGDGVDDAVDHVRIAHPGDTALRADVCRNPFQGHNGNGAGVFGNPCLFGGDDVHDDAALEHLSHAALHTAAAG